MRGISASANERSNGSRELFSSVPVCNSGCRAGVMNGYREIFDERVGSSGCGSG